MQAKGKTNKTRDYTKDSKYENFEGIPSKTIPGESFSIGQLVAKNTLAQDMKLMERHGIFEDDPDYDSTMALLHGPDVDLSDWVTIAEHNRRTREIILNRLKTKDDPYVPPTNKDGEPVEYDTPAEEEA